MTVVGSLAWAITWTGAVLLLVAGAAKVRRPTATSESLALAGLPDRVVLARALGLGEIVLGVAVLATSGPLAATALAVAYAGFAVVSWRLLRSDGASCGCFGEVDAPLSRIHVVTNVVVAVGAGIAVTSPAPVPETIPEWALLAVLTATGAALVRMVLVLVPALADGVRRLEAP